MPIGRMPLKTRPGVLKAWHAESAAARPRSSRACSASRDSAEGGFKAHGRDLLLAKNILFTFADDLCSSTPNL